jgi:hypothetical protein
MRHGGFYLSRLQPILHDAAEPPQVDHAEPIAQQLEMGILALGSSSKSVKLAQMIDDLLEKDLLWARKRFLMRSPTRDHRLLAPHQD